MLNSRSKRYASLPYILPTRKRCRIALLSPDEYRQILDFLPLADLSRLYEALYNSHKTKEGAKTVINYMANR